jgi:hypothetical protein
MVVAVVTKGDGVMDMVERVAKALHKSDDARSNVRFRVSWEDCLPAYQEMIRADARAAIEAMREPTPDMTWAAFEQALVMDFKPAWYAAIDSILKSTRETAPAQPVEEK